MFKSKCLYSEDIVSAHFNSNLKVNLRHTPSLHVAEDEVVCRLCIKIPPNDNYMTLNKISDKVSHCRNMIQNESPEIDLSITEEPIICETCNALLKDYLSFATSCMNVEHKIKMYCEHQGSDVKEQVDLLCVLEFPENKANDCGFTFNEDLVIKEDVQVKVEKVDNVKKDNVSKDHCTDSTRIEFHIKEEEIEIKSEDDQISCDQCTYSTHAIYNLRIHNHTSPNVVLRCNQCSFRTKHRRSLWLHKKTHDPTKHKLKCKHCEYSTYHPSSLNQHVVTHMVAGETVEYDCATCDFKTKHKDSLRRHMKSCSKKKGG